MVLADIDAAQAKLCHLGPKGLGDRPLPLPLPREGGDMLAPEGQSHVEDRLLFLGQREVHHIPLFGVELNEC